MGLLLLYIDCLLVCCGVLVFIVDVVREVVDV